MAKVYRHRWEDRKLRDDSWRAVEALVERFPDLRFTHSYALLLAVLANFAINDRDFPTVREMERRLHELEEHEEGRQLAAHVAGWLGPILLRVFDSPEELEERLEQMRRLEGTIDSLAQHVELLEHQIFLFDSIGEPDRLLRTVERALPIFRQTGNVANLYHGSIMRLSALTALGVDLAEVERSIPDVVAQAPDLHHGFCRGMLGSRLPEAGLLRGEAEWTGRIVALFPEGRERMSVELRLWLAIHEGTAADEMVDMEESLREAATSIARGAFGDALPAVMRSLDRPLLRLSDIMLLHVALLLAGRVEEDMEREIKPAMRDALLRALEWLAARRLAAYMTPLLDRAGAYLTSRELKGWRGRDAAIRSSREGEIDRLHADRRVMLTMFGTIGVRQPEGESHTITGARMKTVLGLIVACQMADRPVSHREFCAIATGGDDPESARNVVYVRLHALREMLGADAIITEPEEAPRLNPERVRVDLLEAHDAFREARTAAGRGSLMRAVPALLRGLEHASGEVPFPGLYENFFEAAREDFENLMRDALLRTACELLREGDAENARRVLQRGFDALPDDEEIAELLCDALIRCDRRAEAERVRRARDRLASMPA
jgi:hypothetical protein